MERMSFARGLWPFLALMMLILPAGCGQHGVSTTSVGGTVTDLLANSTPVVQDSSVPGGKKRFSTVWNPPQPLIQALGDVLGSTFAQAEIIINPTTDELAGNCTAGKGHACLRLAENTTAGQVAFLNPNVTPPVDVDAQRLTLIGGLLSSYQGMALLGLDLTELTPGTDTVNPVGFSGRLAAMLPDRDNVRVLMHANATNAILTGDIDHVGLAIPFDFDVENPAVRHHACGCSGGTTCDNTLPADCSEIMGAAEQYSCLHVAIDVVARHFRVWLSFWPTRTTIPGTAWCDPSPPVGGDAFHNWMRNVPQSKDFDQPCLTVTPYVTPFVRFGTGSDSDVQLTVAPGACDIGATILCDTLVDCVKAASDGAVSTIQTKVGGELQDDVDKRLLPLFSSTGSVFKQPAASPCSLLDATCPVQDMLAGSLTAMTYGWFANLFTKPDAHHDQRYLMTDVQPEFKCAVGVLHVDSKTGRHECVCPKNPKSPACEKNGPSQVTSGLRFAYAIDTDGDGVDNIVDDCPDDPDATQPDADEDGYGNACDPCPCSPDEQARNEDDVCDVCDGSINAWCHGYCQANPPDNCPGVPNFDQANCNKHAEDVLGLPTRGDACDPVPCAAADSEEMELATQFSPPAGNPWISHQLVQWRGVQENDVTPASSLPARGETELAHCNCPSTEINIDQKIADCEFFPGGTSARCQIGNHQAFPNATEYSADGAAWVSETTKAPGLSIFPKPARNQIFTSAYELSDKLAETKQAVWRFDMDFGLAGQAPPTDFDDMVNRASELNGLGWAHTRSFQGAATDTVSLPAAKNLPGATQSDAASHYFIQNPGVGQVQSKPPTVLCPPGGPCGFSAWPDMVCKVCAKSLLPGWLVVSSPAIVQVAGGLTLDVTNSLDPGLVRLLEDPSLELVPFAEPHTVLQAHGLGLEAVTLDTTTLQRTAVVFDGSDGLVGLPLFSDYAVDPPAAPSATTASALDEMVYVVQAEPAGEQLFGLPLLEPGSAPPPLPLDGVDDMAATPMALTYRAEDRSLYLLDQVGDGWSRLLRIVRVDPTTGGERVLARWRYFGHHDMLYLSAATPGELVLTASGTTRQDTLMMTLAPTADGVSITGWITEHGRLLAPPETRGQTGYTMVMAGRHDVPRVVDVPGSSLHRPAPETHHHAHGHQHDWDDHDPWRLPDDGSPGSCD